MNRREFLVAGSAALALGGCRSLGWGWGTKPPRNPAVEAEIAREIAAGYYSCCCCGSVGGAVYTIGDRRPGLGAPVPADENSLFELASVSKTFCALVCAQLWDAGKLDLDAPFTKYLPDHILAKEACDVTVRDLGIHFSGFSNGWMGRAGIYNPKWPFSDQAAYERAILSARPEYKRHENYVYACHNMILLGLIIERVTGLDLDAAARKYVWGPLGMKRTTWHNCPDSPDTVRIWTKGWCPLGTKGDENARNSTRPVGNAGVFSSVKELLVYADDLLNRRTFSSAVYDLLFTRAFTQDGYGRSFGWDMTPGNNPPGWSDATVTHHGYTGQFVAIDPVKRQAAVVLTNLMSNDGKIRTPAYRARKTLAALLTAPVQN